MKRLNSVFIIFLIVLNPGVFAQFEIDFSGDHKTLLVTSDEVRIESEWISPVIEPVIPGNDWKFTERQTASADIAGLAGQCITDVFSNKKMDLERQVWISDDHTVVAVRQKLSNFTEDPVRLSNMTPFACTDNEKFRLPQNPDTRNWKIVVQKRLKNGLPLSYRPAGTDTLIADPFLALPVGMDPEGRCLLAGYLDWTKHLAHLQLAFSGKKGAPMMDGLSAVCEFDDVILPPGGERTTQWIWLTVGTDLQSTVYEYADRVGKYHHIKPPPRNAPSVYCSWYWYGGNYTEEYLLRDLHALEKMSIRKPLDVFLIDECWAVDRWGDFTANDKFPDGMKYIAGRIMEAGYIPGIWSPPYLVSPSSELVRKHPQWVLRKKDGSHYTFPMNDREHLVIDPTYPGVTAYLEESYRKLSQDWGYKYFKFDFMRAVFIDGDYKFYDPTVNRLEAYRMGLEAIRRGVGDDAYISVCGGHYGGSLGIANSQRSGSDVVSYWDEKEIPKYRQNIMRTWMSRLWHVDPDAMMIRRNETPEFSGSHAKLSLGLFTDDEARVNALNQYIGGGLVTFTENYLTLDADRLALYKHVIPSVNASSFPVDWYDPMIPSMMVTHIIPECTRLDPWNTLAIVNWTDKNKNVAFSMDGSILNCLYGDRFLVFEFFSQQVLGIFSRNENVTSGDLAPHSGMLFRIIPWDGKKPVLAGTDLHFSMGGVEIQDWKWDKGSVEGTLKTDWRYPVKLTTVFPGKNAGTEIRIVTLRPGQKRFWILQAE